MFDRIARWYRLGLWTGKMVQTAAEKAVLTPEEAAQILEGKEV